MVDGFTRYIEKQSSGVDTALIVALSGIDSKSCLKKSILLHLTLLIHRPAACIWSHANKT